MSSQLFIELTRIATWSRLSLLIGLLMKWCMPDSKAVLLNSSSVYAVQQQMKGT